MSQREILTTEKACLNLAQSASVSAYETFFSKVNFYTGIDNEVKSGPCVICAGVDATPEPPDVPNLGNYIVRTNIIVKERPAKTTTDTNLHDVIFRQFLTGSIAQDLMNNATNYFVANAWVENESSGVEGKYWVQQLTLGIHCCMTQ